MESFHPLVPHPAAPLSGIALAACVRRAGPRLLDFDWSIEGEVAKLRVPEPSGPRAADGLWRSTCVEAFVRPSGAHAYVELNLAPSRAFAVYRFRSRRERDDPQDLAIAWPPAPSRIEVRRDPDRILLGARLDVGAALGDPAAAAGPLDVGLSAVLETLDGRIAWFALRHAEGAPDFHHDLAFALRLEA